MSEEQIDDAIIQLQGDSSAHAIVVLTRVARSSTCTLELYRRILCAVCAIFGDAHLQSSRAARTFPVRQALCLTSLTSIILPRVLSPESEAHGRCAIHALELHWPKLHEWILYLKSDFVDRDGVELPRRLFAKKSIVDFFALCHDDALQHMFGRIVDSPGVVSTLFSLWRLETLDRRFSPSGGPGNRLIPGILDSWMCSFSESERWNWPEILDPFGGESDAIAAIALDRLQQDVARTHTSIKYDLITWDIHLLAMLSVNKSICRHLLNQRAMTIITNVISSMVDCYTITNQRSQIANSISYGYWFIRRIVAAPDALPWVMQVLEANILSTMLSTEPWIKHMDDQRGEASEPLFLLLAQLIPKHSVYSSALRSMIKQLIGIDASGLPGKLDQNGILFQCWIVFNHVVRTRAALYRICQTDEEQTETCQNQKCINFGPPGLLKTCASCHHVHYCSKECQAYDWRHGGHQAYCHDMQTRRASTLVSRLFACNIQFIDRVIIHDIGSLRDRIQATIATLDVNIAVVELNYIQVPTDVHTGSIQSMPGLKMACGSLPHTFISQKWNDLIELAQRSASKKILVYAFFPVAGTEVKVVLQCLPFEWVFGDDSTTTDEKPVFLTAAL